jgi:Co/Zn/Cd efflux system component
MPVHHPPSPQSTHRHDPHNGCGTHDHEQGQEHEHEHGKQSHNHAVPHAHTTGDHTDPRYRRILWLALIVNAAMFAVEIYFGLMSQSISLLADAIDFAGDALNYGLALAVLGATLAARAKVALLKGLSMLGFGMFLLWRCYENWQAGIVPTAQTMGIVGFIALAANLFVAAMLYAWREGDANMRSVWLCTRNDALSNIAVVLAALGVFGTQRGWPDIAVAFFMAALALWSGQAVIRHAINELHK